MGSVDSGGSFSSVFSSSFRIACRRSPRVGFRASRSAGRVGEPSSGARAVIVGTSSCQSGFGSSSSDRFRRMLPRCSSSCRSSSTSCGSSCCRSSCGASGGQSGHGGLCGSSCGSLSCSEHSSNEGHSNNKMGLTTPVGGNKGTLSELADALLRRLSVILVLTAATFMLCGFCHTDAPCKSVRRTVRARGVSRALTTCLYMTTLFLFFRFVSLL